jgi:GNAT superfamily N-acetyltransferase
MHLEIRASHEADAGDLTAVRIQSKGYWGYSNETLASWGPAMQITPEYIRSNLVRNIYSEGLLVGFYAIQRGDEDVLDHLWLLPQVIGKGMGRAALSHAVHYAGQCGIKSLRIVSDADAEGFYLHLGAKRVGEIFSPLQNRMLPVLALAVAA